MPDDDRVPSATTDKVVIKDRGVDSNAALPPGTLKPPFLGRQGDEQRQPSEEELRKIAEVKAKLIRGEKV